ncbi:MAG: hypothetical protein HY841_09740 [Bacteroidetes bacterium]|nr:hypothetical protein [Bacteroidota bacterium]
MRNAKNIFSSLSLWGRVGVGLLFLFASCKPPLPVYFDKPIGIQVQGFDTVIAGNYLPLDDVIDKGKKEFSDKYEVRYDKIIPKDTGFSVEVNGKDMNYDEVKDILGVKKDSGTIELNPKDCDSIFHSVCAFNELISSKLGSGIDKMGPVKPVSGIVKITYDRIFFIGIDSTGKNMRDTLLHLSARVLLTKYAGKYFINFKTPFGWEIMQMDIWEDKFLSARPFYFTDYNNCPKSVAELTASTKNIYPNLKPVFNSEKKVIGFTAILNSKLFVEKLKKSEEVVLLLKVK